MKPEYEYDPEDYEEVGVCSKCGKTCKILNYDEGIGPYMYGSQYEVHINKVKLSACCGAFLKD